MVLNMPAKKNDISERKKSDRRKKYKEALETLEDAMNFIKEKAKREGLRDQELRVLKDYPDLRKKYEGLLAESLKEEEAFPEGKLKEYVEKYYRIHAILKAIDYPEGKEGIVKVLDEFHYCVCEVCNYVHKTGEECPFIILEKEKSKDG